jgi:hypothetical protein
MREEFLHYVWRYKYFAINDLQTTDGEPIQIFHGGEYHQNSGPDFQNALLRIGETVWSGNVEIHLRSSDWARHKHTVDTAYDNVILHIVYDDDAPVTRTNGTAIPCLTLRERIAPALIEQYAHLQAAEHPIACHKLINLVPELTITTWLERLTIERLEQKTAQLQTLQAIQDNDIAEAFYQAVARSFGVSVNAEPFEQLAKSLPMQLFAKNKHNILTIEALIYGQAGFLETEGTDEYTIALRKEYNYQRHKYSLTPMNGAAWKFLRMRPANFPTIRLAQFANLVHQSLHLFAKILDTNDLATVRSYFEVHTNSYWDTHYVFGKPSPKRKKTLGSTTIDLILINTVVPFLFLYGSLRDDEMQRDKALRWLDELPAEANAIISVYENLHIAPKNAAQSQALLQLKKNYCNPKNCLNCAIGAKILRQ